jgi:hypothetical protein
VNDANLRRGFGFVAFNIGKSPGKMIGKNPGKKEFTKAGNAL